MSMTRVVEADEAGSIHLRAEWLGSKPGDRYVVESQDDRFVLRPTTSDDSRPPWEKLTPQQRADDFLAWIQQQKPAEVHLTDEQLRRENLYD